MSLIESALQTPVKSAFGIGWVFFDRNKTLTVLAILIMFGLIILSIIPLLGIIFSFMLGIFLTSIQVYVGKMFYTAESLEDFEAKVADTTIKELGMTFKEIGIGIYLAWFLISMVLGVVMMGGMMSLLGPDFLMMDPNAVDPEMIPTKEDVITMLVAIVIPMLLVWGLIMYVYPIALGRAILGQTLEEAFKAVFSMFMPSTWKASLNASYFSFIFFFGLVVLGISIVIGFIIGFIVAIPELLIGLVAVVPMLFVAMFIFMYVFGAVGILAKELAFPKDGAENA